MSWFFANPATFQNSFSETIENTPINLRLVSSRAKTSHTPTGTSEALFAISLPITTPSTVLYLHYPSEAARDADFLLLEAAIQAPDSFTGGWHTATPESFQNSQDVTIQNKPINLGSVATYSGGFKTPIGTTERLHCIIFEVAERAALQYLYYPTEGERDADLLVIRSKTGAVGDGFSGYTQIVNNVGDTFILGDGGDISPDEVNLKHFIFTDIFEFFIENNPPEDASFIITNATSNEALIEHQVDSNMWSIDQSSPSNFCNIERGGTVIVYYNASIESYFVQGNLYVAEKDRGVIQGGVFPTGDDLQINTSEAVWLNQVDVNFAFLRGGLYGILVTTSHNGAGSGGGGGADVEIRTLLNDDDLNPLGFGGGFSMKKRPRRSAGNFNGTGSSQREVSTFMHTILIDNDYQLANIKVQFRTQNDGTEASLWNTSVIALKLS